MRCPWRRFRISTRCGMGCFFCLLGMKNAACCSGLFHPHTGFDGANISNIIQTCKQTVILLRFIFIFILISWSYESVYQSIFPSVLPCLGTLAYYLRGVAAQLLMDAGMTGETQTHQALKSAVDSQSTHLVFGSGCLDGHHMMYASGWCYDALLHTFFAQSVGASEFGNAQLLPLAAVVDFLLVLGYLVRYASPVSFLCHSQKSGCLRRDSFLMIRQS